MTYSTTVPADISEAFKCIVMIIITISFVIYL